MERLVLSSFAFIVLVCTSAEGGPVDGLEYQSESVATAGQITAGIINPAGLAFYGPMGIRYTHSFTDSSYKGDDGLLISSRRGFFALEWLNHTSNSFRRKYTLGMGDRLAPDFYLGFAYSWFGGSDERYKKMKNWKLGMMYHPRPFASLGLVAERLNQPRFDDKIQRRLYRGGLAVRPFGERFTVSSDLRWLEGEGVEKLQGNFRAALSLYRGVFFSADYATEGSWRIGLTLDFDQTRIGTQGRLDNSQDFAGGSYFIELSSVRYGSVIRKSGRTGTITLSGDIVEEPTERPLFGSHGRSLYSVIAALRKGSSDQRISGLFMKIDGMRMSFSTAQELRNAVLDYRENGKDVVIYLESGGNLAYYLASAADEIYMNPSGYLELDGLSATAIFYTGIMAKLGIEAQVLRTGPHKTYGDQYTEQGLTPEAEEQIEWLLDDLYDQLVEGISAGRRILSDDVKELIDNGPYTAKDALAAGLIDGLKYCDEFTGIDGSDTFMRLVDLERFYKTEDYSGRWSEPKKIAIIYADGSIAAGHSGRGFLDGKRAGAITLSKSLELVRSDRDIRAVVLRVNSPGGDLFASDRIYRELELLKGRKPLVVSMGGVAASGGYYISSPGDEIVASPGTITGSIGVVVGKPDLSGFYEKIGLNIETIKRGERADIRSFARPATSDEMELIEKQIWQYYDDFVSKVSAWRKLDYDSVDAIGQGRVWTGRQALKRGLVDSYGGVWEAVQLARLKAGIDPEDKLIVKIYPRYGFSLFRWPTVPKIESYMADIIGKGLSDGWLLRMPFDLNIK